MPYFEQFIAFSCNLDSKHFSLWIIEASMTPLFLIIFLLNVSTISTFRSSIYKKVTLEGNEWSVFINKTVSFSTNGLIECGTLCTAEQKEGCDLFTIIDAEKLCHLGFFKNTFTNFLTGQEGTQPVYVNNGNFKCYCIKIVKECYQFLLNLPQFQRM